MRMQACRQISRTKHTENNVQNTKIECLECQTTELGMEWKKKQHQRERERQRQKKNAVKYTWHHVVRGGADNCHCIATEWSPAVRALYGNRDQTDVPQKWLLMNRNSSGVLYGPTDTPTTTTESVETPCANAIQRRMVIIVLGRVERNMLYGGRWPLPTAVRIDWKHSKMPFWECFAFDFDTQPYAKRVH